MNAMKSRKSFIGAGAIGVIAAALLLSGCSSNTESTSPSESSTSTGDMIESPAPSEEGDPNADVLTPAVTPLPAFSSTTLDGQAVTQVDFEGTPTIMWFWTPWCAVCRAEAPTLAKVANKLAGSVEVVGVAALGSIDEMKTFVSDTGIENFTQLADPDAEVWSVFGVASQPAFAFISADGSIEVVQGVLEEDAILERAATLG